MHCPSISSEGINLQPKLATVDMATQTELSVRAISVRANLEASGRLFCPKSQRTATPGSIGIIKPLTSSYLSPPTNIERLLSQRSVRGLNELYRAHKRDGKSDKAFIKSLRDVGGEYTDQRKAAGGERVQLLKAYKERPAIYLTGPEDSNPSIDVRGWLDMERPDLDGVVLEVYTAVESRRHLRHARNCTCPRCRRASAANMDAMMIFGVESDADGKNTGTQNENRHAYIDNLMEEVRGRRRRDSHQ